mmetsp:Transcript_13271/g.9367  ORF Transcript_13271/g.9367 Transcript_13271/m.9367 type:complete len:80 (-) Transcript_13271:596-835(-)
MLFFNRSENYSWIYKLIITPVMITTACLTGYTRMLLGYHTLNQVVFGLLLGAWVTSFMYFVAKEIIYKEIASLTTCDIG